MSAYGAGVDAGVALLAVIAAVLSLGVSYAVVRIGSIAYFKTRSEYDAWLRRTSRDHEQDKSTDKSTM